MSTSNEESLREAIETEDIDRIKRLITVGPITSETIKLVIQTKNRDIAKIFIDIIQDNTNEAENSGSSLLKDQVQNILKNPSTKELINQAISLNDFNFSYLALTLLVPPVEPTILNRLDNYQLQNNVILFTPALQLLNNNNLLTSENVRALTLYLNEYDLETPCPKIVDCFVKLHGAGLLNEENRQLIIKNPKWSPTLVDALIQLKQSNLASDEITLQAITKTPYYYENIIAGLVQLKESGILNLLSDDNRRDFLNNPSQHQEIIHSLEALRIEPDLFKDDSIRQAIIKNPTHYQEIIAGLIQLREANLLTRDNQQLIVQNVVKSNPYYTHTNLVDDLIKLDRANILSTQTGQLLQNGQSKYMLNAIIDLHNEKILDTFTNLLPNLADSNILSVALGLTQLKKTNLLTEQTQNLMVENQDGAAEISQNLVSYNDYGFLNDDILELLSKNPKITTSSYLSSLLEKKTIQNVEHFKQVIMCYDDLSRFKKNLPKETFNLLIQQNDLTVAVRCLNKLAYSNCRYDNLDEFIMNSTRPGFADALDLLEEIDLITEENIQGLIQQKDISVIVENAISLVKNSNASKEKVAEFITNTLATSAGPIVSNTDSVKISLHEAIKLNDINIINKVVDKGPITTETIELVIQTKNAAIAQSISNAIQKNSPNNEELRENPSTKELINQAIAINDFNFSYLALTLLAPPVEPNLLNRLHNYQLQNNATLFTPALILLNRNNLLTSENVSALALYLNKFDSETPCPKIVDCFVSLHSAGLLNEENRQLIIKNPKWSPTLVDALIQLKKSDLASDEITLQAILKTPYYYENIIAGLVQLKESGLLNLLSDDNRRDFLNNPSQHQEIMNSLNALKGEQTLFNDDGIRQAIIKNPTHHKEMIAGLIQLKEANLLTRDNQQLIVQNVVKSNPYYTHTNLVDDLIKLDRANILSTQTGQLLQNGQSKYMLNAIIDLHNEKILDTFTSLLPNITNNNVLSVALGLARLKKINLFSEQTQNLMVENQDSAIEISQNLVRYNDYGLLNDDILELLSKNPKITQSSDLLSLLKKNTIPNVEQFKQVIIAYDDLVQLKDKLTEENYNLLIQQKDLTVAVSSVNKLLYSHCPYDNLPEYITNCTRPGFDEVFDLFEMSGLLTQENLQKLIQQEDIDVIIKEITTLAEKGILNKDNLKEFLTQMTQQANFSTAIHEYSANINNTENHQTPVKEPMSAEQQPDTEIKPVDTAQKFKDYKKEFCKIQKPKDPDLCAFIANIQPHLDSLNKKISTLRNEAQSGSFPLYTPDELAGRKADALQGLVDSLNNATTTEDFKKTIDNFESKHINISEGSQEVDINKARGAYTQWRGIDTDSTKLIRQFQDAVNTASESVAKLTR